MDVRGAGLAYSRMLCAVQPRVNCVRGKRTRQIRIIRIRMGRRKEEEEEEEEDEEEKRRRRSRRRKEEEGEE